MIKNLLICMSAIGLTAVVAYLLCKKRNTNIFTANLVDDNVDIKSESHCDKPITENNNVEEMYQVKNESAQSVCERHMEAGEIMTDAFKKIYSEIEPVETGNTSDIVVDVESVEVMKNLDTISDELDELLK